MAADGDDLLGMFSAYNLAHYVAGLNVRLHVGFHLEMHCYRAFLGEALDHESIFYADCCGGNLRLLRVINEGSSVRNLHGQTCGRPHKHCRSAFGGDPRGAVCSVLRIDAVALPTGVEDYDFAFYLFRGHCFKRIEAGQKHDRRGDTFLRGCHAHAEPKHMQRPGDLPRCSRVDHRP